VQGGRTDNLERLETYGALLCASVDVQGWAKRAEILSVMLPYYQNGSSLGLFVAAAGCWRRRQQHVLLLDCLACVELCIRVGITVV